MTNITSPWANPSAGTSKWSDEESALHTAAAKQSQEPSLMQPLLFAEQVQAETSRFGFLTFGTFGKTSRKPAYETLPDQEEATEVEEETAL